MIKIDKVTCFILNEQKNKILLFEHETSGIQIPGGTIEKNESPIVAAIREANEETGISKSNILSIDLIHQEEKTYEDICIIQKPAKLYSKPSTTGFDWINIKGAIKANVLKKEKDFTLIEYIEYDKWPNYDYITYRLLGWVENNNIVYNQKRYFYQMIVNQEKLVEFTNTDNHKFYPFWCDLENTDIILPEQQEWISILKKHSEH